MFKYYKQSKISSRAIALLLTVALATVIAWRFNYEIVSTISGVIVFAVLAEVFFFHIRFMIVTALSLVQAGIIAGTSLVVYTVMSQYTTIYGMSLIMGVGMALIGAVAILLALVGNYFFSKGRLWINILVSFLIYDAIAIPLLVSGIGLSYIYQSLMALGGMLIYIVARHYLPRTNIALFDIASIKTQKGSSAAKARLQKENPNLKIQEINNRVFLASNDKVIFVVLPITPSKYFSIINNDAFLDSETVTGLFEHVLSESKDISYDLKINKKFFIPVLYITTKSTLKSKLSTIRVRNRITPERIMGNIFIATPDGFNSLLKGYERYKQLPAKVKVKLESFNA